MLLFLWVRIESYLGACLILSYLGACLILLKSSFGAMVSFQKDLTRGEATSELTHLVVTVVCYLVSHVQLLETPWPVATRILCPWDFSGKSTDVGLPFPSPGILPTQESNLCLLHWQEDSFLLSHLDCWQDQSLMSCDLLVSVFPYLLLRVALLSAMRSFSQVRSHNGSWLPSERIREESC